MDRESGTPDSATAESPEKSHRCTRVIPGTVTDPAPLAGVIDAADLIWRGQQPFSLNYGDIYHGSDGAAEVERVFLAPSHLTERMRSSPGQRWLVGETGFGSGLNFAVLTQRFLAVSPLSSQLHFVSFENQPVSAADFAKLARVRAADFPIYQELTQAYPPLLSGWHRRYFAGGRICLSLFFGTAARGLEQVGLKGGFHAWFLDGFAPDRNPELWQPELLQRIAALSLKHSTIATFTAAGHVRRSLIQAGYHMRKIDQKPYKRHTLAGTLGTISARGNTRENWCLPSRVTILGGGIAGSSTARLLAEANVGVDLIDSSRTAGAGNITDAVLHARLLRDRSSTAALRVHSFHFATHWLRRFRGVDITGVLQTAGDNMSQLRLQELAQCYASSGPWIQFLDRPQSQILSAGKLQCEGLWLADGGRVNLPALCQHLTSHPNIHRINAEVTGIQADNPLYSETAYRLTLQDGREHMAAPLVLCSGASPWLINTLNYLEVVPVEGQLDILDMPGAPPFCLVGAGYFCPQHSSTSPLDTPCDHEANRVAIGATFEHSPWPEETAREHNLSRFVQWWSRISGEGDPGLAGNLRWVESIRGTRAVASDRLPVVGEAFSNSFEPLPNLLLNLAHGSNGTTSAALGADRVSSYLLGEFPAQEPDLCELTSSLRFRTRQARRGYRHGAKTD